MVRAAATLTAGVAVALLLLVACGSPALPPPLAGEAPSAAAAPARATPAGSGPGASAAAASALAGFSDVEARLLGSIRSDARVGCAPRRENLPEKSTGGIECTIGSDLVDRVGVYAFPAPNDALAAYTSRLAGYGVALRSGDCLAGTPGDAAWTPGDGPTEGGDLPWRTGCFLDENGKANIRVICGVETDSDQEIGRYIGVLGASTKIRPLLDWVTAYEAGVETPVPTPPGICTHA
jgi:hypothetical protein